MHEREQRTIFKAALEWLALIGPLVCLIDCVVIPLALAVLPLIGAHQVFHGISDQIQATVVLCICAPVLVPGFLRHRKKSVLVFAALGFASIFLANFAGHDVDHMVHALLTIAGSSLLIKANFDNRRLNSCQSCCGEEAITLSTDKRP